MEKRRSKRVTVNLKAERISCTDNCSVFIENLSESGISMLTTNNKKSEYVPGSEIDLELELKNGDTINLNCNVKWVYNNLAQEKTKNVGLEIIDPPQTYMDFIKSLN
jgi:Tfp pilus assembly protein PilZ